MTLPPLTRKPAAPPRQGKHYRLPEPLVEQLAAVLARYREADPATTETDVVVTALELGLASMGGKAT